MPSVSNYDHEIVIIQKGLECLRVYENYGVGFIVKKTQEVLHDVLVGETSGALGSIF